MSIVLELIKSAHRQGEPLFKGDLPGHEFHGNQWTGGEGSTLYHVTETKNVAGIKEKGLLVGRKSNWVKASSGKKYGKGVYAFENKTDAIRWAAKMDWAKNSDIGTGSISIIELKTGKGEKWFVDENDPLTQVGKAGAWLYQNDSVKPAQITGSAQVTKDMIRTVAKVST